MNAPTAIGRATASSWPHGAKRVTDICRHRHGSAEAARECAEWLASLRST